MSFDHKTVIIGIYFCERCSLDLNAAEDGAALMHWYFVPAPDIKKNSRADLCMHICLKLWHLSNFRR